jgi:hypothetical protein
MKTLINKLLHIFGRSNRRQSQANNLDAEERIIYDELTGFPSVAARPGQRKVTYEEIRKELEDFP